MYMYEFRTKPCTKEWCQNPSTCFDYHSEIMRRRVPKYGEQGLFNYIPKPCLQCKKNKKCPFGDSCPWAHGWLEVIYHPLLYKTKLCNSYRRNRTCPDYGVYCAKAHHPTEIRNLVKIYGWNWKRHYDLSFQKKRSKPIALSGRTWMEPETRVVVSPEKWSDAELLNSPLSGHSNSFTELCLLEKQGETFTKTDIELKASCAILHNSENSTVLLPSPPLAGLINNQSDHMSDMQLDDEVSSYIELYNIEMNKYTSDSMKLNLCRPINPGLSEHNLCSVGIPYQLQNSSPSSMNSTFWSPISNLKSYESKGLPSNGMMNTKQSEWAKEKQLTMGQDTTSNSLFAELDYEGNWNK